MSNRANKRGSLFAWGLLPPTGILLLSLGPWGGAADPSPSLTLQPAATCEASGSARCWYVAPDGNDSNPGTFEAPFRKPQTGVLRAGPGDFIYLRGGVYDHSHGTSGRRGQFFLINPQDGSAGQPGAVITLKSYPGERAITRGKEDRNLELWANQSYWRIEGLKIEYGKIAVAKPFFRGVHHIWIVGNEISDFSARLGNAGLIKIDGNTGDDPRDIYIWNNVIHGLWGLYTPAQLSKAGATAGSARSARSDPGDREERQQRGRDRAQSPNLTRVAWNEDIDREHHACITILQGSGLIEIKGNEVYHCAAIFYFKFEWDGPVVIENNLLHDAQVVGMWRNSNNEFRNNVIYDVGGGIRTRQESQGNVIEHNTWVGLGNVLTLESLGGHRIRDNVVFGGGYLSEASTATGSLSDSDSDSNCFITSPDFVALGRGKKGVGLSGLNLQHGLDLSSVRFTTTDRTAVFADPANRDFSLIGLAAERCPEDGARSSGPSHTIRSP